MKERIQRQLDMIKNREHRKLRRELTEAELAVILPKITDRSISYMERATLRLEMFLDMEKPVLLEDTRIQGMRTIIDFPDIYAEGELDEIRKDHWIHERAKVTNLAWDYGTVLKEGLEGRRARLVCPFHLHTYLQRPSYMPGYHGQESTLQAARERP